MAGTDNSKPASKRDPDAAPANQLVDAVIAALAAGVGRSEIISALRLARGAGGYKAPVWRAAAQSMNDAAASLHTAAGPQAQSDVELRGPGS